MIDWSIENIVFVQIAGAKTSSSIGGGLSFQESLARELQTNGYNVYAITNPADKFGFLFLEGKRRVVNYKGEENDVKNWFLFDRRKLKYELNRVISDIPENSVFVTVDPFPPDIVAASYLKSKLGKKTIVTMHHITPSPIFHPFRRGVLRTFISWMMSQYALIVIKTHQIPVFLDNLRIARFHGWRLNDILMEMPISLKRYLAVKPALERFQACYVGRLTKNKGINDLILAWKIVVQKIPSAHLKLIGIDLSRGKYKRMIEEKGLTNNIELLGYLSDEEKQTAMDGCTLFPFPSYEEGWSLSVMEAIDNGILPILYDLPAYDYICNSLIKIRPGDVSQLADRIIYLFEHPEKRITNTLNLQSCICKYTLEYVFNIWLNQVRRHVKA